MVKLCKINKGIGPAFMIAFRIIKNQVENEKAFNLS